MSLIKRKKYPFHLVCIDTNLRNDCNTSRGGAAYLRKQLKRVKFLHFGETSVRLKKGYRLE